MQNRCLKHLNVIFNNIINLLRNYQHILNIYQHLTNKLIYRPILDILYCSISVDLL